MCECSYALCLFVHCVDVTAFTVTVEGADVGEGECVLCMFACVIFYFAKTTSVLDFLALGHFEK